MDQSLNRSMSTKFEDHTGLIHQLTHKCYGRLKEVGVNTLEYEDVFQINCETFVMAAPKFNPEFGVTFGAYLGRAIYNQFNRAVKKIITEHVELGMVSYHSFVADDDEEFDFLDCYEHEDLTVHGVEQVLVQRAEARERISKLSPIAKVFVRELIAPTNALVETVAGLKENERRQKAAGVKSVRAPGSHGIRAIKMHYGFRQHEMNKVRDEFKEILGVEIG